MTQSAAGSQDAAEQTVTASRTRQVVTDFADQFYVRRDVAGAFNRFVAEGYIQHNPGIADGRDAAIAALAGTWANPDLRIAVRSILVDGDTAVLLIDGQFGTNVRFGVVDIYRLAGDVIVEHWDVKQEFPAHIVGDHPFFS
ncbi:nuclear transport factor 2 family protein [Nakamurella sp. GG22]